VSVATARLGAPARTSPVPHRRFSVEEYHRMVAAGILGEDERVELLEGEIVQMSPQKPAHMRALVRLNRFFSRKLSEAYVVRPQGPLQLADSEPEPDLAIVRADEDRPESHPGSALLVVEVADSSLRHDLTVKMQLYAKAGIPEYWLVIVPRRQVEVLTEPDAAAGDYRRRQTLDEGGELRPRFRRGLALKVGSLFD
jgi:Uma2 family endonuclease